MGPKLAHIHGFRQVPRRQAGMGAVGWLLTILSLGGAATLAGQLVPLYVDQNIMANVLEGMAAEEGFIHKPDSEIQKTMKQRFRVNGVRTFNIRKNIKINRTSKGVELVMDYEIRMDLVRNIDMVVSFYKKVELRK